MYIGRRVVLAILFGCIVSSAAKAGAVLYRGAGIVQKNYPSAKFKKEIKNVMVGVDASNNKVMRFGYKVFTPDGGEQTVAIGLNEGDVLREDGIRRGKAQLVIRSGSYYPHAFESAGTWKATGEDYSFHAEFPREGGSSMEVIVSKELNSPSTMWDAMPDVVLNISVNEYPPASETVTKPTPVREWKIASRLDFNALLQAGDTSAIDLVEELFFD